VETTVLISAAAVPVLSGLLGWVTNWTGVLMLYYPVRFRGVRVPGLAALVRKLPRRIQQVPGLLNGGLGWQGIIPSRAAKMGSVTIDKGISKLGSPSDFYGELEPDKIAEHIVASSRGELREMVERIVEREHPQLWRDLPSPAREALHRRIQEQLPEVVATLTEEIGEHIDQLFDIKLMVIQRLEQHPDIANRVYREVGDRELRFIIHFGLACGFVLGIPAGIIAELILHSPVAVVPFSVAIGWVTNHIAIKAIFEPATPKKIGPFTLHGLFVRRQHEGAGDYARVISEDVITIANIGDELLHGPRSDRTRHMIEKALRAAIDRAVPSRPVVRVAVGEREYDAIRESIAEESIDYTLGPMRDPEFSRERSRVIRDLMTERARELPPADYAEMLRSGMREDEWLLYLHGAVLGVLAGLVHVAIFPL
jgi:uncharacterized membrane protein YheB (UPF0754 family)